MAVLEQYNYIFIITLCFSILDAWNIGANDVASSFATSISSRSMTMKQAMFVAAVCEFSGAVSVGSRVSDTIRTKIIRYEYFEGHASVLLLAMMCTLVASSIFMTVATRNGFPVSTTHSIMGGIIGASTAAFGIDKVHWGLNGVSQVFLAWIIAPAVAGSIGAALFIITKNLVLTRNNAVKMALYTVPFYTFITIAAITMLVVWHGIQLEREATTTEIFASVLGTATAATLICIFFILPFMWRKIVDEDWTLHWYDVWYGPRLLKRPHPPPTPAGYKRVNITNYYRGYLTPEELASVRASETLMRSIQSGPDGTLDLESCNLPPPSPKSCAQPDTPQSSPDCYIPSRPPGEWFRPAVLWWRVNRILLRGLEQDIIRMQKVKAILSWDIAYMHACAPRFNNKAEHMYSFLQVLTAAAASFTHGANDVSNAVAPLTTAYRVWQNGEVDAEVGMPLWILVMGGAGIVAGLMTYGYHVMRNLGNHLTLMSPSRGFCMELASATTVLLATKAAIPISTTQCITGATIGVGLANGDWRCINYKMVAWIYLGWIITLPVTAVISGTIMGFVLNAPNWESNV
ncbi:hypothetical protein TD95_001358 [Thielaviopsis punctulata]|uniref:Phosphate transporter n=1 Tax=Thielaviopsis punctulata TaxID=72032 RepID=A0A0F4ZIL2_9PEZI|nr:hypothetical protein TD95_001358 [Thielaviopsis punctulata]